MESGGSREGQRGAGAQRAEASRNRGATGTSGLIWRRGTIAQIHHPFLTPLSPAPCFCHLSGAKHMTLKSQRPGFESQLGHMLSLCRSVGKCCSR